MIIGIVGRKHSGKSTITRMIVENNPNSVELSFAKKLKQVCSKVFNLPMEYMEDQNLKEKPLSFNITLTYEQLEQIYSYYPGYEMDISKANNLVGTLFTTPRYILQFIGTEFLRECLKRSIHLDVIEQRVAHFSSIDKNKIIIISDVRFQNEVDFVRETSLKYYDRPALVLGVDRPGLEKSSHPSEIEIENLILKSDRLINNNSTLTDLELSIYSVLEENKLLANSKK